MKIFLILFFCFVFEAGASIVPKEAYTFDFNLKLIRMSRMKEDKIYKATDLLREIFSSSEFKRRVLNHRFNGKKSFAFNKRLSNRQIYEKILMGVEKQIPYRNNAMDVEIELYTDFESNVLGFTRPNTKRIWMNRKYFDKYCEGKVASHLTHEWLHKLGFDHEREQTWSRKYSVPYGIGYIVKDMALKRLKKYRRSFNSRY